MFYQDLGPFWMLPDQKGRVLVPFLFSHWLIFAWLQCCPWERKGMVISKPLFTLFISAQLPSTNDPVLQITLHEDRQAGNLTPRALLQPAHSTTGSRYRDLNSLNTLIGQKTAKTRTTNSHQKLSRYSWSHMGVYSTQLIAPWYF